MTRGGPGGRSSGVIEWSVVVLSVAGLEDFESLAAGPFPGSNFDSVVDLSGSSYAERFAGQTLGTSGDFDTLSGAPTGPLSLVAGAANQNLVVAKEVARLSSSSVATAR